MANVVQGESKVNDLDKTHRFWMHKIIEEVDSGTLFFKEYIPVSSPPMTCDEIKDVEKKEVEKREGKKKKHKKKDKKKDKSKGSLKSSKSKSSKKSKRSKEKKKKKTPKQSTELLVKVNGEIFFTDPTLSVFDAKNTNDTIAKAYVLLSVDDLMKIHQKSTLNPFIIKIDKIEDIDAAALIKANFKTIFVRYNIPFIAQGRTLDKEIQEIVRFNESHACFTNTLDHLQFVQLIQSQRFFVEVCGTRDRNHQPTPKPKLFGSNVNDKYISRKMTPTKALVIFKKLAKFDQKEIEVLASVSYDLTSFFLPSWGLSVSESCHNPDNIQFQKAKCSPFETDETFVTTNNTNIKTLLRPKSKSPLHEGFLMEFDTRLEMEFYLTAPIFLISHEVISQSCHINRMFVVIKNKKIAVDTIDYLFTTNKSIGVDFIVPNRIKSVDETIVSSDDFLTGFIIDNGEEIAIYMEGVAKNHMAHLWQKFVTSSRADLTVNYNNNGVFAKRQYAYFVKMGGFLVITMSKPFKDILAMEKFYIGGSVPMPCWEAVKKLDLLFRCSTLKDMNQYNLFPSVDELLSFDLEFGSAVRRKEFTAFKCIR